VSNLFTVLPFPAATYVHFDVRAVATWRIKAAGGAKTEDWPAPVSGYLPEHRTTMHPTDVSGINETSTQFFAIRAGEIRSSRHRREAKTARR
jgi:hypothetical protein